ncbi:MAG: hypothetical protein JWM45_900, partial [Pseudonocardiales bacterium]|nr:hypothetical protein [Pseudonocardiales bacterium]
MSLVLSARPAAAVGAPRARVAVPGGELLD